MRGPHRAAAWERGCAAWGPVSEILDRLGSALPRWEVASGDLQFFTDGGPVAFWERLRELLRGARRRVSLATLYWGTGAREAQLVDDLRHALERSPELTVRVVVDHSRGRRNTPNGNTVTFLRDLAREFPGRVELYLHRMPQFDGPSAWLPSPLDECVAVFHFKAIVADDVAIITGANLSDEYWHCRQARYLTVRDRRLVELFHNVVDAAARHSLRADFVAETVLQPPELPPTAVGDAVLREVCARSTAAAADTVVVPLFQHPRLGLRHEYDVLVDLLGWTCGGLVIHTPYPNFPEAYVRALERRVASPGVGRTQFVGPSANSHSFSTGRGLKALVPGVYMHREREFTSRLDGAAVGPLDFRHYDRAGWVFHSKGVWFTTHDETATIIGSSSFGERSVERDFDLSFLIVTSDPELRRAMAAEVETMLAWADGQRPVDRPGAWAVPLLVPWVKAYL